MNDQTGAELLRQGQVSPVWWVRNVLGDAPWKRQQEILTALVTKREVNVRSCHSAGKSWVASRAALWFLMNHPNSLVITTAPTARQVRGILWKEINMAHQRSRIPLGGEPTTTALRINEGWMALGFTAAEHDPDRFQGFHADSSLVIIDEACGVSEQIDMAVDSILSGEHCRLLRIGNPTNISTPFGNVFRQQRGHRFKISAFDTPNFVETGITLKTIRSGAWRGLLEAYLDKHDALPAPHLVNPEWVADKWQQWGETSPMFQSRILAEFPQGGDSSVVSLALLEQATARQVTDPTGSVVFGVDVARHGNDETVIAKRQGDRVEILAAWNGLDTMQTVGRIISLIKEHKPSGINVDEIGLGAGVLDRLNELGHNATGINVAKPATDSDRFENLRAEMFWNVRELLEAEALTISDDSVLIEQTAAIRYEYTSRGRIKLESKSMMSGSPDRADALALALLEPRRAVVPVLGADDLTRTSPWGV